MLPDEVLRRIHAELFSLRGTGSSILEIGHRSPMFESIVQETRERLRELLEVPATHEILFLQGGGRLQFSMIPLNLATPATRLAYIVSGAWSKMACEEAARLVSAEAIWNGAERGFRDLPPDEIWRTIGPNDYLYFTSNETIHGVQFRELPVVETGNLICDMSSDFLSRPVRVGDYSLLFACAQKNAGIAGLTIVVVARERLRGDRSMLPGYLDYRSHIESSSLYNTPPTFGIYVLGLMLEWLQSEFGSLARVAAVNAQKAARIYAVLDEFPDVYAPHAAAAARSRANVTFAFQGADDAARKRRLESFLGLAASRGMTELRGHRTLGGVRVSLYNAMPLSAVEHLAETMAEFAVAERQRA